MSEQLTEQHISVKLWENIASIYTTSGRFKNTYLSPTLSLRKPIYADRIIFVIIKHFENVVF